MHQFLSEMIFMSEEKLVPKLRFSGFTDEWNEVTLNDVATFSKGKGISKNDISNYGIECVRYGELYTKYNEMIYNIESKTDLNKNELKLSEKNDILMPCSGETAIDLATASCIQKDQVAIGGDITVIKTNQYAPFITYYLNQKKTEIAKYAQGVSIVHLYPKDFKVMNIRIPSINEQKMIIGLLEEITKKEQLLESKYQQYQEFKKYLMQQIFTQKLRFDFDEIRLKSISKINKGKQLNKEHMLELGKFYVLNGGQEPSGYTDSWNTSENTITISEGGNSCGFVNFNTEKFWSGGHCYYLNKLSENIDVYYLYSYLKFIEPQIMRLRVGSGLPNIQKGDIENIKIKILPKKEQIKISNLLLSTDNKISSIESQKDSFEIFKKGLLQQMFV